MTTWTLSELGCTGNCKQGEGLCDCQPVKPKEAWHFTIDAENGETKAEVKVEWEF